ncbi:MAG TPA: endonuclease III [Calditrichae bacterium]|nr:endonuclease III [Calditrichia bacterium]
MATVQTETLEKKKARVQQIIQALKQKYPEAPLALKYSNPLELLVAVILSAQCTDERVNQVTEYLFKKYRSAKDYVEAPQEELENDIRPTGYYRNKAKSLKACCQKLLEEYQGEVPRDIEEMVKLPGVGRKTAAMVLGNAYGLNQGIAVDTHVRRVVERLQLSDKKTPEKIEQDLMQLVPQEEWTWFSNALILHGRHTCTARKPKCGECVIERYCPYPEKNLA